MKRFLMLVGVAAVAAAMYVAASPASQQSSGPTEKQFVALQKKVTALTKSLKTVKSEANAAVGFIATCFVSQNAGVAGVSQFGDVAHTPATFGYWYTPSLGGTQGFTTALDADSSTTPGAWLQAVDPSCVNTNGLRHRLQRGSGRLALRGELLRH
jgi:hypothetical protein